MARRVITAREQYELAEPFLRTGAEPVDYDKVYPQDPAPVTPAPAAPVPADAGHFHPDFKAWMDNNVDPTEGKYENSAWEDYHKSQDSADWWHTQFQSSPSNAQKEPVQNPDFVQWMDGMHADYPSSWRDYHNSPRDAQDYHKLYEEENTALPPGYVIGGPKNKNTPLTGLLKGYSDGELNYGQATKAINQWVEHNQDISKSMINPEGIGVLKDLIGDTGLYSDFVDLLDKKNHAQLTDNHQYDPHSGKKVPSGDTDEDVDAIQKLLEPVHSESGDLIWEDDPPQGTVPTQQQLEQAGVDSFWAKKISEYSPDEYAKTISQWQGMELDPTSIAAKTIKWHNSQSETPEQPGFSGAVLAKDLGPLFGMDPEKVKIDGWPVKDMTAEQAQAGLQKLISIHGDGSTNQSKETIKGLKQLHDLHFGDGGSGQDDNLADWEKELLNIHNIPDWAMDGTTVKPELLEYMKGKGLSTLAPTDLFDPDNPEHVQSLNEISPESWGNLQKNFAQDTASGITPDIIKKYYPDHGDDTVKNWVGNGNLETQKDKVLKHLKKVTDPNSGMYNMNAAAKWSKIYEDSFGAPPEIPKSVAQNAAEAFAPAGFKVKTEDQFFQDHVPEGSGPQQSSGIDYTEQVDPQSPWAATGPGGVGHSQGFKQWLQDQGMGNPGQLYLNDKEGYNAATKAYAQAYNQGKPSESPQVDDLPGWVYSSGGKATFADPQKEYPGFKKYLLDSGGYGVTTGTLIWKKMSPATKEMWIAKAKADQGGGGLTADLIKEHIDQISDHTVDTWVSAEDPQGKLKSHIENMQKQVDNGSAPSASYIQNLGAWKAVYEKAFGSPALGGTQSKSPGLTNLLNFDDEDEGIVPLDGVKDTPTFQKWFNKNYPNWTGPSDADPWDISSEYHNPFTHQNPDWLEDTPYSDQALDEFSNWQDSVGPEKLHQWIDQGNDGGSAAVQSFHDYLDSQGIYVGDAFDNAAISQGIGPNDVGYYQEWKDQLSNEAKEYFTKYPEDADSDYFDFSSYEQGDSWQYKSAHPSGEHLVNYYQMGVGDAPDELTNKYGDTFLPGVGAFLLHHHNPDDDNEISGIDSEVWEQLAYDWANLSDGDKQKYISVENSAVHPDTPTGKKLLMSDHQQMVSSPEFKAWFTKTNSGANPDDPSIAQMLFHEPENTWTQQKVQGFKKYLEVKNDPDFQQYLKDQGYGSDFNLGSSWVHPNEWSKRVQEWGLENDKPAPFNAHSLIKSLRKIDPEFWDDHNVYMPMAKYSQDWHRKNLESLIAQGEKGDFPPPETAAYKKLYNKYFSEESGKEARPEIPGSGATPKNLLDDEGSLVPEFQDWLWSNADTNLSLGQFLNTVENWTPEHWQAIEYAFRSDTGQQGTDSGAGSGSSTPGLGTTRDAPPINKPPTLEREIKKQLGTFIDKLRAPESKTIYNDEDIETARSAEFQRWFMNAPEDYRKTVQQFPYIALDDFSNGGDYGWAPKSDDPAQVYKLLHYPEADNYGGKIKHPSGETLQLPGEWRRHWPGHTKNPEAPSSAGRPRTDFTPRPPTVPGQYEIPLGGGSSWEPEYKYPEMRRGINIHWDRYKPNGGASSESGPDHHRLLSLPGEEGARHRAAAQMLDEIKELMVGLGDDQQRIVDLNKNKNGEGQPFQPTLFDDNEAVLPEGMPKVPKDGGYSSNEKWMDLFAWGQKNQLSPEQMWLMAKKGKIPNAEKWGTPPLSYLVAQSKRDPKPMARRVGDLIEDPDWANQNSDLTSVEYKLRRIKEGYGGTYDDKTKMEAAHLYDKWFGNGFMDELLAHKILDYLETGGWKPSEFSSHPTPGGMGPHWTTKNSVDFGDRSPGDWGFPVQVVADWPGLGEDPDSKDGADGFDHEKEVTKNPGTPMRVKQLRIRHPLDSNREVELPLTPHIRYATLEPIPVSKRGRSVLSHRERFATFDESPWDLLENPMDSGGQSATGAPVMSPEQMTTMQHRMGPEGKFHFPPGGLNPPSDSPSRPNVHWQERDPEHPTLTDDAPRDRVPQSLFRGLSIDLNHPDAADLHRVVFGHHPEDHYLFDGAGESKANWDHPELATAILDHLEGPERGLGSHWSVDPWTARDFALSESHSALNEPGAKILPVRLRADWKGLGEDPYRTDTGESFPGEFSEEGEVTMLPGAGMPIRDVQIQHPETGRWLSVLDGTQHRHAHVPVEVRPRSAKRIISQRELMEG